MRLRPSIAAGAAVLLAGLAMVGPAGAVPAPITCIAHRGGANTHTEETEQTYTDALDAGVIEVEGDVRWTSTGYPYLLHNADLGLFSHPTVDLVDISGTTATGPTYVSATGDKLMSLYALRELLLDHSGTRLQAELKTTLTAAQWTMLASRLDPVRARTTITSFSKATVQAAQEHGYRTGLLASTFDPTTEAPAFVQDFATLEPDDVAIHAGVGVSTQTWTIDTSTQWDEAAAAGVTAIITNQPAACMTWEAAR
jgi:glycerophosphoryl diester phosphodiesterase